VSSADCLSVSTSFNRKNDNNLHAWGCDTNQAKEAALSLTELNKVGAILKQALAMPTVNDLVVRAGRPARPRLARRLVLQIARVGLRLRPGLSRVRRRAK